MIETTGSNIETLEIERQQNLDRAKTITDIAKDSERDLSAEESTSQGIYLDRVEKIDAELATLARIERLEASRAVTIDEVDESPSKISITEKTREPGFLFAQMALALHRNNDDRQHAAQFARAEWGDELLARILETPPAMLNRAAQVGGDSTTATWATELVKEYDRQADEFIDLLRAETVAMQINPRRLALGPDNAGITIPKQTAGVTGGWVGEQGAIKVAELATGEITLTPKKVGCIVVISQELANQSSPAALQVVRDDLVAGMSQTIDSLFISNTAAAGAAPAGILNGITANTASAATASDLDKVTADLKGMEADLNAANVRGPRSWVMSATEYNSLLYLRETGTGVYAFRDELRGGTLSGHRVIVSNNVTTGDVILASEPQILWATGRNPEISLTNEATLHMDSAPRTNLDTGTPAGGEVQSLWQTDQVATRILTSLAWGRRHDAAISWVTGVGW